ncbi:hypothetical protein C8J57DRAFT_1237391 [Mycena rebaudengoi]|nr:hypothetical protein C8J57DRAFT_1237391 [Mycena rebaudengoi]
MNPALTRALEPGATRVRRKKLALGQDRLWPLAEWLLEDPIWAPLRRRDRPPSERATMPANEATPYTWMGPETAVEKEWRMSMQGLADLAEEWVAEGEANWQEAFQSIADWASEQYGLRPMPEPGTDTHWMFVNFRELQRRGHGGGSRDI